MTPPIIRDTAQLRAIVKLWKGEGLRVGLVPTMGALHAGHLSLVRTAHQKCDRVIVSAFVNPKQFDNPSDLAAYPRTEESDVSQLSTVGFHMLYSPSISEMYPNDFATLVSVTGVSEGLCGDFRPGHFDGVATVVTKLFMQAGADVAFFGEKDFQQLHVVRRLVRDLDIPIEIVGCPIVREMDGLAMSSRNVRLSDRERSIAPKLAEIMRLTVDQIAAGSDIEEALTNGQKLLMSSGYQSVEYLEFRSEDTLQPLTKFDRPARLMAAAWLGDIRLIDNVAVGLKYRQ